MPFEPLITGVIESALNRLIHDNPVTVEQLARLKGQVIQVHIQELAKNLIFVFSQQVDVLSHYEGQPDCYLSLKLAVLPQLKDQSNITRLIKQDQLVLEGDVQLAQRFSRLINDAKPELEEWLSRLIGDPLAHTLAFSAKSGVQWLDNQVKYKQSQFSQLVTEEWRCVPPPLEVAHFCDQVDQVRSQFSRLEARINALLDNK